MGIDWEEQLGAEGADMARAYEDSLPEEDCGTAVHDVPEKQYVDVEPYISNMMLDFDDLLICCGLYNHELIVEGDPYVELEDKTCDELIEECIKLGQDAKHAKHALKNAGQDIDTLLDYLDKRVLGGRTVSSEKRKEFRTLIESKVKYEEESMGCDELREKYGSMTRDELIDKHVEINGVKDAAEAIAEHIEAVIDGMGVDLYDEFEDKQDLKDLIAKYKKTVPETMEEDDEAITEKDKEAAQEKHVIMDGPAAHWEETLAAEGTDMVDDRPADNDVLGQLENMTHDELVDAYIYCKMDLDAVEGRLGDTEFFLKHAEQDLQTLMDILKEHGIQIPKDVEERYNDLVIWG